MLILARESRGMSQTDLARTINVTQGKISKYENGMLHVAEEDLERTARVLDYTTDFFFQQDRIYGLGSSFLFNRKRKTTPLQAQKRIQAQINVLRMQVERLLRGAEMETENQFEPLDVDAFNGNAAKVAREVRAAWKLPLGPVSNMTAVVESAGGIILKCAFGTRKVDAAHLWVPGLPPLFFLNKDLPGDRFRWTLAHEVGHAIMHRHPTGDVEEQANMFASEFLLPEREIDPHLPDMSIERAAVLKQHWKVSMAALIMRARDLGAISERKYRTLFTHLSWQGYKTNEPFPIAIEEPQLLKRLVAYHRDDLGYNNFDLARLLFSPDPQFFEPKDSPSILRFDNRPFFIFSECETGRRNSM
jgi:Zn-dependent peptidase ImmA (M78 family)/transcriptional regulator with XRE-family HTH domain